MLELSSRVAALEAELLEVRSNQSTGVPTEIPSEVSTTLTTILSRCNDAENRLRRSNVLFYGLNDEPNESWKMSEKKIIDFCARQ